MDHFILNSEHICWRSVLGSRSALGILNHSSSGRVRRVNSRSWWYLQATASTACIDSALTDFHPQVVRRQCLGADQVAVANLRIGHSSVGLAGS